MRLEEIFDIAKRKRFLIVSSVNESGAPEAALMGFALTQAHEVRMESWIRPTSSRSSVGGSTFASGALTVFPFSDTRNLISRGLTYTPRAAASTRLK